MVASARAVNDPKTISGWLRESRGDSPGAEFANINESANFQKWLWGRALSAAIARQRRTSRQFGRDARRRKWDNWRQSFPRIQAARKRNRAASREAWIADRVTERATAQANLDRWVDNKRAETAASTAPESNLWSPGDVLYQAGYEFRNLYGGNNDVSATLSISQGNRKFYGTERTIQIEKSPGKYEIIPATRAAARAHGVSLR